MFVFVQYNFNMRQQAEIWAKNLQVFNVCIIMYWKYDVLCIILVSCTFV